MMTKIKKEACEVTSRHFAAPPGSPINLKHVEVGVNLLLKYIEKNDYKNNDNKQPIFLQITSVKVPKTPNHQIRLNLKNTLLSDSSEICLLVKDDGTGKDHDETIKQYEDLLKDNEITNIKTIMPYHQFKTEYGNQYELVTKLLGLYDYFLVDGRISGYFTNNLGTIFSEKRKMLASVYMDARYLKEHFEACLKKTLMQLHTETDYIVEVGHTKMSNHDVFKNISHIIDQLDLQFPGGLDNILSFGIKTDKSIIVSIYPTLENKSKVPGALTSFVGRDVTILPTAELNVSKPENRVVEGGSDERNIQDDEGVVEQVKANRKVVGNYERGAEILDETDEVYLIQHQEEWVTTRKAKKLKMVENDEIPVKKSKRAINEQNENTDTINTRTRGIKPKPEEVSPVQITKKPTKIREKITRPKTSKNGKKADTPVIPDQKQENQKGVTETNQSDDNPVVDEPETKSKTRKQKGFTKTNNSVDGPAKDEPEIKPKTRKQKGSTKTNKGDAGPVQEEPETKPKTNRRLRKARDGVDGPTKDESEIKLTRKKQKDSTKSNQSDDGSVQEESETKPKRRKQKGFRKTNSVDGPVKDEPEIRLKTRKQKGSTKSNKSDARLVQEEPETKPKTRKRSRKSSDTVDGPTKDEPEIKPTTRKQKGPTKSNKSDADPVQEEPQTKPKTKKQKGFIKTNSVDGPVKEEPEIKLKTRKQKGLTKTNKSDAAPVQNEPETKPKTQKRTRKTSDSVDGPAKDKPEAKPKRMKQERSTKNNQSNDALVQDKPEPQPKTTRKTKAKNVEEAVPVKKIKISKKSIKEDTLKKTK